MKVKTAFTTETERMARTVTRCYSKATLQLVATEMGASVGEQEDIFRALIRSGGATDFDHAVAMVVSYLDASEHEADVLDDELEDGKIERRKKPRQER